MAESVIHVGGVRFRLNGEGNLDCTMLSLDNVKSESLRAIVMDVNTAVEPTRLCNFKSQRYKLRISTDEFGEYFIINRIVLFVKELYKSLPAAMSR